VGEPVVLLTNLELKGLCISTENHGVFRVAEFYPEQNLALFLKNIHVMWTSL
jgi:hypothetical protein